MNKRNEMILQVKNLSKDFFLHEQRKKIPSAHLVNFNVSEGKLTALMGLTGSGKSTILKVICRTYLITEGSIYYHTTHKEVINLAQVDEQRIIQLRWKEIGFVTQFLHCFP